MANQLPTELKDLHRKQFVEEKHRQRLRETNHELRELEQHLRRAYFIKNLKEQQNELAAKKADERLVKEREHLELEESRKRSEELLKNREIEEQQKKNSFRETLKTQMLESVHRRKEVVEEMSRDGERLERILQNLKIEQEREKEELEARQESIKQDLEEFMKQQEAQRRKEREVDEQDRVRALEVQRQRDEERKRMEEIKRQERLQQAALSEKIGLDIYKTEREKQRREKVMLELLEEERQLKEDHRFRENLEHQVRARERVRFELETFIEKRKLEKEMERRNKISAERAEMERIISEAEKEAAKEIKRLRDKEQAYNKAIQQMLEERRQGRASEIASHLRDYELMRTEERKIQQEVDDERMRLLQRQPSEVLQYLPAGVLRESDREFLALPPGKSNDGR